MKKKLVILSVVCLLLPALCFATGNFSRVVGFGDSVSDNGFADGAGYQVYSNGLVWVEYLANALPGGPLPIKIYAWGGAMTNEANWEEKVKWSGLLWQVEQYKKEVGDADISSVLHTIYCGGNDFWGNIKDSAISSANIVKAMDMLVAMGAKHILLANQYSAVTSPGYQRGEYQKYGEPMLKFKKSFNANLQKAVFDNSDSFSKSNPTVNLYFVVSDEVFSKIANDEPGFKFENKTHKWLGTKEYPTPTKYLWWDDWHLMTQAHRLFADHILKKMAETSK